MEETISDIDLRLNWVSFGQHLKVTHKGNVVYSSISGLASPLLSERQVKWITEDYEKKRKKYVFGN